VDSGGRSGLSQGKYVRDMSVSPELTLLIPVHNELENIEPLYRRLCEVLEGTGKTFEILMVDDGSTDGSLEKIRELGRQDGRVHLIDLGGHFGQTPALAAGSRRARGAIVVMLDADLQNDPADIPRLLEACHRGLDVVCGWRRRRADCWLTRTLPSLLANRILSWITGVRLHDFGCTLRACRRELLVPAHFWGESHRFLPALLARPGARIGELEVTHHPRRAGRSKYGLSRVFRFLGDLVVLLRMDRPAPPQSHHRNSPV
jgi:glycosyltransferase involved in cell wall biosynthesis